MGILDEAIKEHLELKRQHGAADAELKQLEDEAFGPPERPAPTVADLQEPPPAPEPAREEEPELDQDREAIAEQPTEHFDVEEELAGSGSPGPSDEELVEEEMDEPRLAPVDPLADIEEVGEVEIAAEEAPETAAPEIEEDEGEDDFWNEQRLSEELDQALDAPLDQEDPQPAEAEAIEVEPLEEPEDAEAEADPDPDGDVLEKTPDFLEEAPEDDELWFEQKPPKDFDFDD